MVFCKVELCVCDVAGAQVARAEGVDRIELCQDISVGGVTPSLDLIEQVLRINPVFPMQILIRCRPGNFVYEQTEIKQMSDDIRQINSLYGSEDAMIGFVVGALTEDGRINVDQMHTLMESCAGHPVTFHRAFDATADLLESGKQLIDLGCSRILTTGGDPTRAKVEMLRKLQQELGDEIGILASGGLRAHNVSQVISQTGVPEVHMRAPFPAISESEGAEIEREVAALASPDPAERTDPREVHRIIAAVRG